MRGHSLAARPAEMIDDRLLRERERSGWLAAHYQPLHR